MIGGHDCPLSEDFRAINFRPQRNSRAAFSRDGKLAPTRGSLSSAITPSRPTYFVIRLKYQTLFWGKDVNIGPHFTFNDLRLDSHAPVFLTFELI